MNSNNKYGTCCGCPAIANKSREFTNWTSARIYNTEMMKKLGKTNSNDYRESLQNNSEIIIKNTFNDFETNYKCKNNGSNVFYIDSSKFNDYYDNLNVISSKSKSDIKNYEQEEKGTPVKFIEENMSLSSLSFAPFDRN